MKKILTLFALLVLICTGAWAAVTQPTVTTDPSNPTYYTIKNFRTGNYATYMGESTQLGQRNGITYAAIWYFTESGNGVKLVPAVDPTKKLATHSSATAGGATWYLKENPYRTGYFCVSLNEGLDDNCWDDQGSEGSIGYWKPSSGDNQGTSWAIEEVDATTLQTAHDDWNSYPVNIGKAAGYTRTDRFTTFVKLGSQTINVPNKNKGTLVYRFISDQSFSGVTGETVVPSIGFTGAWMHGLLYMDLNNDGDFEDSGELVSQTAHGNNDNALNSSNQTLPQFTLPAAGTYRMRFMVIWVGDGNTPNPKGSSSIFGDGGCIYDVMINIASLKDELEAKITEAQGLYTTLSNGASTVAIGYPTSDALQAFQNAIDAAQAVANDDQGDYSAATTALEEAIAAVKSPANTVYTPRTDVYYTITSGRGSMIYHPDYVVTGKEDISFLFHTGSTKNSGAYNVALDATNTNHLWGFIYYDNKYYMYNVGKKQFANVSQNGSYDKANGDGHTWIFSNAPSAVSLDAGINNCVATPNVRVRATSEVTGLQYAMSISPSYDGPVIAYDEENDGGIPMTFAVSSVAVDADVTAAIMALLEDLQPYRDALQDAITAADAVDANIGTGLHQYTATGDKSAFDTALADAKTEVAKADNETSKADLIAKREALENAQTALALSLNVPQAGTFLRMKSVHDTYLSGVAASNGYLSFTTTADASTIFYFDGNKLLTFGNGLYANGREVAALGGAGLDYRFEESTITAGKYVLRFDPADGKGERFLYAWGTTGEKTNYADQNTTDDANCAFTLTEVTELPITLRSTDGENYFATFSAPVNVQITGAALNRVEKKTKTASYTAVDTDELPAGTGVLLTGTTGSATATIITNEVYAADYGLKSYYAATAGTGATGKLYLGKGKTSGKAGFYKLGNGTTSNGFKAYLEDTAAASGEAKEGFELVFGGEVTGINTIENGADNGAVFNLQGQRVNKAQKGVYIQNGKKVVLK